MTDPLRHNAFLVDALGSSMRSGDHALGTVPSLLKRILQEEAWREFITQRGDHVQHARFADFVTTPPLKGLGATMDLVERIVGTDDPDLLILLRDAKAGQPGRPRGGSENPLESNGFSTQGESVDYTAARLALQAPEEFEAVRRGEKSIHAAAVAAGIRRRRIPVRLDDASSALRSLQANSSPEFWEEFKRLVTESE